MSLRSLSFSHLLGLVVMLAVFAAAVSAQSTDQRFPSPVRTSEIAGVIKARDIGDPRLTTHFYTFEGGQGDLFVNVQTSNFSGDVDVYAMPGLRPLTKMVMYADSSVSETGRVIYLRKPETILLRIEGRTPGDDEATYRIKFAGSFVASNAAEVVADVPKAVVNQDSGVRVNSVGTIIEVAPRPTPAPRAADEGRSARADTSTKTRPDADSEEEKRERSPRPDVAKRTVPRVGSRRGEPARVAGSESRPAERRASDPEPERGAEKATPAERSTNRSEQRPTNASGSKREGQVKKSSQVPAPDPMANVRLVIRFKDGSTIERPMTDVFKFTVERAVLTVISKDGAIGRYQMIDVAGVTIE